MSSGEGQGMVGGCLAKIRRTILHYNIYGRIVTKKRKGCSHFYDLLNMNSKNDGWVKCGLRLEVDFSEANLNWQYDEDGLIKIVIEILRTPNLNGLKQFMLRLLRNNLFFGKKSTKN